MEKEEKLKALEAALSQIERQYGKGAVMKLGDPSAQMNVETIPTGSLSLDIALGLGGIPKGRIVEIYGPESSGKTTVTLHMIAEVQKRGGIAGFIDAEHALDPVYAKNIGVDVDNLYISQPDNGEQALEITETMVRSGAIDIVVVDSVAALVPKAEIDGDMGDSHVGLQARLMSQALRKLTAVISKSNCTVIFINQLREKVGIMFGNPETTTGGRALKFYSSVRLDVRRIESLKQSGEVMGNRTRVKVVKNKIAPPFKEAEFDIMFGEGISAVGDILDLAANENIVNKSGAWYAYGGNKIGQGSTFPTRQFHLSHSASLSRVNIKAVIRHLLAACFQLPLIRLIILSAKIDLQQCLKVRKLPLPSHPSPLVNIPCILPVKYRLVKTTDLPCCRVILLDIRLIQVNAQGTVPISDRQKMLHPIELYIHEIPVCTDLSKAFHAGIQVFERLLLRQCKQLYPA